MREESEYIHTYGYHPASPAPTYAHWYGLWLNRRRVQAILSVQVLRGEAAARGTPHPDLIDACARSEADVPILLKRWEVERQTQEAMALSRNRG